MTAHIVQKLQPFLFQQIIVCRTHLENSGKGRETNARFKQYWISEKDFSKENPRIL